MTENPQSTHLEKIKLASIATDTFTDEEVEDIFLAFEITSNDDIDNVINILAKYRPALYKKYAQKFKRPVKRN